MVCKSGCRSFSVSCSSAACGSGIANSFAGGILRLQHKSMAADAEQCYMNAIWAVGVTWLLSGLWVHLATKCSGSARDPGRMPLFWLSVQSFAASWCMLSRLFASMCADNCLPAVFVLAPLSRRMRLELLHPRLESDSFSFRPRN